MTDTPRILVAGELNADLVMTGLPSLPVLGHELLGSDFCIVMGSSSAITAARLATLGADVDFVGLVGDDDLGRFVTDSLAGFGVGTDYIQRVEASATGVTIALTYENDRALLTYPSVMTDFDGEAITPSLLSGYTHIHVGSFFLQVGLQAALPRLFRVAHEQGLTTSLDVGWDPYEQWLNIPHLKPTLAETDFFFPNEDEATILSGGAWNPAKLAGQVRDTLVVKRGAQGALAIQPEGGKMLEVSALPVNVVDTTGAGDAFNAGFLYAVIVARDTLENALKFAAACGAQAVMQVGGASNAPDAATIRDFLNQQ